MKIVHVSTVHAASDTRIFLKECASLAKAGYNVHLLVPATDEAVAKGVTIHPLRDFGSERAKRVALAPSLAFFALLKLRPDVVHFHDPELIICGLIMKLLGKRVIYDVHEDLPQQLLVKRWVRPEFRRVLSKVLGTVEFVSSRYFDYILPVTEKIGRRFPERKTVLVQNYPIAAEFDVPSAEQRLIEAAGRTICFVGSLKRNYGVRELVEAIGRLDGEARLLLGGSFLSPAYEEEVRATPGWEYVEYLGWLSRSDMSDVFARSVAGAVIYHAEPNIIHGRPNKLFEYMSASLPVIASDFPDWRAIVEGTDCGWLVEPDSIEHIAEAIRAAVMNPREAVRRGSNGAVAVEKEYSWKVEEEKLLKVYAAIRGECES